MEKPNFPEARKEVASDLRKRAENSIRRANRLDPELPYVLMPQTNLDKMISEAVEKAHQAGYDLGLRHAAQRAEAGVS
jgi:hypothetical protein